MKPAMKMRRAIEMLLRFARDDRAQALTEYVVLMLVVSTICFFLYHPDNGFYAAMRARYDLTTFVLLLPGP